MTKKDIAALFLIILHCPITLSDSQEGIFKIPTEYSSLIQKNYEKTWISLTGFEFSGLHWKQYIRIFVNQDADVYQNNYHVYLSQYLDDEEESEDEHEERTQAYAFRPYSQGTIFIKEHFLSESHRPKNALTLAIMIKREAGYDKDAGDWQYVQSTKEGKVIMAGNSRDPRIRKACQECHQNMAERDYVFSTFYSLKQT